MAKHDDPELATLASGWLSLNASVDRVLDVIEQLTFPEPQPAEDSPTGAPALALLDPGWTNAPTPPAA